MATSIFSEMTAARLDMRGTQKQIIAQQEQEITALKARIASLEREIAVLRGTGGVRSSGGLGGAGGFGNFGEIESKH